MTIQIPDHYCIHLQSGISILVDSFGNNSIKLSPCAKNPFFIDTDNLTNVFLNEKLVEIRRKNFEKSELEGHCATCTYRENSGLDGKNKTNFNSNLISDTLYYNESGPRFMTLQIDTTCNLACTICSSTLSTKWRLQDKVKGDVRLSEDQTKTLIKTLDLSNLQILHIFGGEPFLSPLTKVILNELQPYASNITIWFDNNATVKVKDEIFDLLKPFKKIQIKFSIDGIQNAFEYMRWPANWNNTVEVINYWRDNICGNYELSLRPAVGFLNFHIMNDLKFWYIKNYRFDRDKKIINFDYTPVQGMFSAKNMSDKMIDDAYRIYKNDKRMLSLLPKDTKKYDLNLIKNTLQNNDKKRGLRYEDCLPHLLEYLPK